MFLFNYYSGPLISYFQAAMGHFGPHPVVRSGIDDAWIQHGSSTRDDDEQEYADRHEKLSPHTIYWKEQENCLAANRRFC